MNFHQTLNHIKPFITKKRIILFSIILLLVWYIFSLPRDLFEVSYSTVVKDKSGEMLGARIAADGQWRFPACDSVPEKYKICLLQYEDRYFPYHWGVNPLAIGRALVQNIKEKRVVSGGSTITMQTIRLSRQKKRTVKEKIIEIVLATRLEFRYSKEKIVALYASHAPFGGNVVGIEAAMWRYFGHSAEDISWAEAATLAILPNAPSLMHLSKNRELLLEKRNKLLSQLHKEGHLDEMNYALALSEPLPGEPLALPQIAPHLVSYLHGSQQGEQIKTNIDKSIQTRLEGLLERWQDEFSRQDIRNIAALVIDVQTAQVIAYCGNVHFYENNSGNQVDIIQAPRSTGSILKPLLYCAALQDGDILPHTLLPDVPININGFTPKNFNLQYDGAVAASQVMARSLNVPSVVLLRQYGVSKFYQFLKKAGLSTLNKPSSYYGLSLILGGAEATLWDVSTAYMNMGRTLSGLPNATPTISKNDDLQKNSIQSPFSAAAVWQTFNAIKELNRPEEIDWRGIPSMQTVAWKTGTSFGFRDAWAVGVTPRYVVGVWVGNANGEGKAGLVGARTAGPILFDVFNILPKSVWFQTPYDDLIEAEVCRISGHLSGRFCEEIDTLLICPNGLKSKVCPYHTSVTLSQDEQYRIYQHCAGNERTIAKSWFVLPPAWEWYYKQRHPQYKPLPPFKAGCGGDSEMPMQFIYPQKNARISLPKQLDGSKGSLTFELAHNNSNAVVFWHLDEDYISTTRDFHTVTLSPTPGQHSITVVDNEGHSLSIRIDIE